MRPPNRSADPRGIDFRRLDFFFDNSRTIIDGPGDLVQHVNKRHPDEVVEADVLVTPD
jgi:hypothetical protein